MTENMTFLKFVTGLSIPAPALWAWYDSGSFFHGLIVFLVSQFIGIVTISIIKSRHRPYDDNALFDNVLLFSPAFVSGIIAHYVIGV